MEKNLLKLSFKKVSVLKLTLALLITVSTLFAAQAKTAVPVLTNSEIAVSPEGVVNDEMVFSVQYNNANEAKLRIRLVDENGTRLYNEVFTGKSLNKTFKVDADLGKVYLIIDNTVTQIEQRFAISTINWEKLLVTSAY